MSEDEMLAGLKAKLERSAELAAAGMCSTCEQPQAEHCQECWMCPGSVPAHEDMCGF